MTSVFNPFSLSGKTILVTGASSGIGKSVSMECSKMGATLIITGRNEMRLENTMVTLNGTSHQKFAADLRNSEGIDFLIKNLPEIDGIVHCAGIADPIPFQFVTKKKIEDIFSINFIGPTLLTNRLVKEKLLKSGSSVVFISSVSGIYCSYFAGSIYGATKGAINGLIKGMALDLSVKKIRVNAVCPAMIETNILEDGRISKDQLEEDKKKYPMKRYGTPEEVAYAVIYLLSDATQWMTGANLLLDGGYTLL